MGCFVVHATPSLSPKLPATRRLASQRRVCAFVAFTGILDIHRAVISYHFDSTPYNRRHKIVCELVGIMR